MDRNLKSRIWVGMGGGTLVVGILVWGHWLLFLLGGLIVGVAMKEFFEMMERLGAKPLRPLGYFFAFLYMFVGSLRAINPEWGLKLSDSFGLVTALFVVSVWLVQMRKFLVHDIQTSVRDLGVTVLSALFVGGFMSFIFQIKGLLPVLFPNGQNLDYLMLLPFCGAWGSDTGGYFCGKYLGTKKLVPKISPKKTVEGAIGGVMAASACCSIIGLFVQGGLPFYHYPIMGLILGGFSLLGDLAMSTIKRESGVKDTGSMMAAHGGALDRVDSVLLAMPTTYFYLLLFANWHQLVLKN